MIDKVKKVFQYLLAVKSLTIPVDRDVNKYISLWWEDEIPNIEGCYLFGSGKNPEAWLEVHKQNIDLPPVLPQILENWIIWNPKNPTTKPVTKEIMDIEGNLFTDSTERVETWEKWLVKWDSWSIDIMPKYLIQKIYGEFFALYQTFQSESETIELAWGHGLLTWHSNGERVKRPLFVTHMELVFNSKQGSFEIVPNGKPTALEIDMLAGIELPNIDMINKIDKGIQEVGIDPRDKTTLEPLSKQIVNILSPSGKTYFSVPREAVKISDSPIIYDCPVLFLRKRSGRQWQTELKNIIKAIDDGCSIPAPIISLVTEENLNSVLSEAQAQEQVNWRKVGEEILFPLPANNEQKEIVQRLAANYGVTVQGPPGTGKSHTIANLVSHLLAHGKRVLVTSHTERALRVLADKIPEEIRPLCVSVTGGDLDSIKEVEQSIRVISENLSIDVETLNKEIDQDKAILRDTRAKVAELRYNQRKAAENEHMTVNFKGAEQTPLEIAKWIKENEERHGWLPDSIDFNSSQPSHEKVSAFFKFAGLLKRNDIESLRFSRPITSKLPSSYEFKILIDAINQKEKIVEMSKSYINGWHLHSDPLLEVNKWIEHLDLAIQKLQVFNVPWLKPIFEEITDNELSRNSWIEFKIDCEKLLKELNPLNRSLSEYVVEMPEKDLSVLLADFEALREHLNKNTNLSWIFTKVTGRKYKYILDTCKVNNSAVRTVGNVEIFIQHITKIEKTQKLVNRWNSAISEVKGEILAINTPRVLAVIERHLRSIEDALKWHETIVKPVRPILSHFGILEKINIKDERALTQVKKGFEAIQNRQRLEAIQREVETLRSYLISGSSQNAAHRLWNDLIRALDTRNSSLWDMTVSELNRLASLEPLYREFDVISKELSRTVPRWVAQTISDGGNGEPLVPPKDWIDAWTWAQGSNFLKTLKQNNNPEELQRLISEEERNEANILKEIISKSTWVRQIERTTETQKRSLYAWIQAIRRVGKGTGKYADKHRLDAKKEMEKCRLAIPVWIMPVHKVIENFSVSDDLFDVVIVDEASQCDLFALVTLFRSRKAVIVGDDKQISPESVGKDQTDVNKLIARYLTDIPQKERYDMQTSLYDTALRIFPGNLMLKEHFRSIPEIIQFSNDQFYGGDIEPLRLPETNEILSPPILAVRVSDGFREESTAALNYPEAEALVDKVIECCGLPEYKEKSMGVISLQGRQQAIVIQEKLREKLGDSELINRKLICGEAYSFQGDERDVIFLSMVAANNTRIGALVKAADEKRFNVAASRARDQMWLFHSVDIEDLNPNCMRAKLLGYCLDPKRTQLETEKVDDLFESDFERDVFKLIIARGYAVRPQVKVGKYNKRIDLVVEGLRNRLAVECDGDKWHGPEQWEADQERQRLLERIGWVFWRVRGSVFYSNPENAMRSLWDKLEAMGIEARFQSVDSLIAK
ncbi:AAA domain-containing protein [Desulfosporosinus sp. OT]|uniref:AAA domain-containing protein n=1 Tax=Desulfosporosinus sp. OT TaxID=913865 RepID=UPI000223A259|nr:AAA domain-containing protein [Desulfosporosinus sp. OT]EGW41395.1 hypothetical protein DOT_0647 [Desulfosporosinus sp. OT]